MKKEEIVSKLKSIRTLSESLSKQPKPVYETSGKYIEKYGLVSDLETQVSCAKAFKAIKSHCDDLDEAFDILGIKLKEKTSSTYMGFGLDSWKSDIQKRVLVLQTEEQILELKKAEKLLMKHRSDDDIFSEDIESISDILKTVE